MVTRYDSLPIIFFSFSIHAVSQGLGNVSDEVLIQFMDDGGKFVRGKISEVDYIHIPGGWIVGHRSSGNTVSIGIRNGTVNDCNTMSHVTMITDYAKSNGLAEMKVFLQKIVDVIKTEMNPPIPLPSETVLAAVPQAQAAPAPPPSPTPN